MDTATSSIEALSFRHQISGSVEIQDQSPAALHKIIGIGRAGMACSPLRRGRADHMLSPVSRHGASSSAPLSL